MPLGYRSTFSVRSPLEPVRVVADQFRSCLRRQNFEAEATTPGIQQVAPGCGLVVTHRNLGEPMGWPGSASVMLAWYELA
jgi:hypothetical protein